MSDVGADEELAGSGGGNAANAVLRVSAGADHRRIADAAPAFGRGAAGRRAGGDVAAAIKGDDADSAELVVIRIGFVRGGVDRAFGPFRDRQAIAAQSLFKLVPTARCVEIDGEDFFQVLRPRERFGAFADQHDVWRMLHNGARGADRVTRVGDAGDGASSSCAAVHDGGVEFVAAFGGEDGAAAGIEERIVLHFGDHGFNRVK